MARLWQGRFKRGIRRPLLFAAVAGFLLAGCQRANPATPLTPALPISNSTPGVAINTVPGKPELPPEIPPSLERGELRAFYNKKYTAQEFDTVRSLVEEIFPNYTPQEKRQAITEILSFSYVIFHETEHHHLDRNHAALRKYEKTLIDVCKRYQVPPAAVSAIVSWENSGGVTKVSFADAAGLGQMTDGAIQTAHDFAHQEAARLREEAPNPAGVEPMARHLETISIRHQQMTRKARLPDERFVPECNLEDVALFFKFLLNSFGGRVDHAIGSYHRGVANTDDVVYDYLTRTEGAVVYPNSDRSDFLAAMDRRNVTYVTLWNDARARQMLNGLRTMDGEVTTDANRSEALGDESDIYPWKVLGSLAAYRQGPEYVQQQIKRYSLPQSEVEVRGLPTFESFTAIREGLKAGKLIRSRAPILDVGFRRDLSGEAATLADSVTPELEGYLHSLVARWRSTARQQDLQLPVKTLFNTRSLSSGAGYGLFSKVQMRGVTALLSPRELSPTAEAALKKVLEVDFLNDRIYRSTLDNGDVLVCLNPRFGHQFWAAYQKYRPSQ